MMRDVDVAVVQLAAQSLRPDVNVAMMVDQVDELAAAEPTDLVVFPELATTGYVPPRYDEAFRQELHAVSEPVPGPTTEALAKVARAASVHVVYGCSESGDDGALFNSAVLVTPAGEVGHVARKVHLWREEVHYFEAADRIEVVDTSLARMGLSVCYDSKFPEVARTQAVAGAELLVGVFALAGSTRMPWTLLHRTATRAMENNAFCVAANRSGADATGSFHGGSVVAAPSGEVVASDPGDAPVVRARLSAHALREARDYSDFVADRRPEVYGQLAARSAGAGPDC